MTVACICCKLVFGFSATLAITTSTMAGFSAALDFPQWHSDGRKAVFSVGNRSVVGMACGCCICTVVHWHLDSHGVIFSVDALPSLIHGRVTFSTVRVTWVRVTAWVKIRVYVTHCLVWASCFQKVIDWLICRLCLCCHRRFQCWLHSWITAWWLTVCVIDYETNCTIIVLHITNNLTEAWRLLYATAELLL